MYLISISAVPVTMLRIQWPGEKQPTKHTENVRVGMFKDPTNNISLRISVDQKVNYFMY